MNGIRLKLAEVNAGDVERRFRVEKTKKAGPTRRSARLYIKEF
jgi:hypothetical protein